MLELIICFQNNYFADSGQIEFDEFCDLIDQMKGKDATNSLETSMKYRLEDDLGRTPYQGRLPPVCMTFAC